MANIWKQFQDLIPGNPLLIGEVAAVNIDGTCTITMPGGSTMRAIGSGTVGKNVFIKDGTIQGDAPDLAYYELEI